MSLARLKERLNHIITKQSDEATFDVSEQNTWLQKISRRGNQPDDWWEYINLVKNEVTFPNNIARHNFLNDLYEKALQDIKSDNNRNSEAYAKLFVSYAWLKSEYLTEDVQMIFNQARAIVRKFAFVHIASAKFELETLGNKSKALKILEKALLFEAKPAEELKEAIKNLMEGKEIVVNFEETVNKGREPLRVPSGEVSQEVKSTPPQQSTAPLGVKSHLLESAVKPSLESSILQEHKETDSGKPSIVPHVENTEPKPLLFSEPGSLRAKTGLRTYHSTPLLNSEKKRSKDFAPPMRVKRINLPFAELVENEEPEHTDTMDSFKPLDTHHGNGVLGLSHAHTSGYQSMTQFNDSTISMEIKPPQPKRQDLTEEKLYTDPIPSKPFHKPMIELPEPKIMKPIPEVVPSAPKIAESKGPPQVMQPHYRENPSNPVMCTPSMKGMSQGSVIPSTPMTNMKMITVNGQQYGILGVIGKGGSSKVYKVLDSQYVVKAVKVVNLDNANDSIVEGYKNEIKLLKRLQYCDKVIKMYDNEYVPSENKLYVVMESGSEDLASFFRGQTKDRRALSDNLIRFYWEIMLEAVQALHREGIIHSDLKPANFLLVGGKLKLIDFGIAKALQQDKTGVILETQIGTLNYMSPEAIKDLEGCADEQGRPKYKGVGKKYNHSLVSDADREIPTLRSMDNARNWIGVKSDVWSLGCILYNMVYGRTPFQHLRHDFSKLQAIINPDFPIEFPDIQNKNLIDVMKRCLCRNPKSRPSIDELLSHPYLTGDSQTEEVVEKKEDKIINKKMEALVSTLASQYALSPGGVRNLIKKTIDTEQCSPDALLQGKSCTGKSVSSQSSSQMEIKSIPNPMKPALINRPQGPVTIKHMRPPLQSLDLQSIHPSTRGQGHDNQTHRNPAGS